MHVLRTSARAAQPPSSTSCPRSCPPAARPPAAGYSADKIPQDNKDLTFDGSLHDLAVVKLSQAIAGDPTTVDVVGEGATLAPGQMLQVAGWGTTETGSTSNVLK
jgi:hypothetical protein